MDYTVEKKVPIPEPPKSAPLESMKVGDSISFSRSERSKVQTKASRLKKERGMAFTVRMVDADTCRVWRTE